MRDVIRTLGARLAEGGDLVVQLTGRFDLALLLAGLGLHLVADAVRNGGWHTILRAAAPEGRRLRLRDVQVAAFAGGGVNTVVPARAGDLVKIALLRRRMGPVPVPVLAATLVPETAFELAAGAVLLAWAMAAGYLPAAVAAEAAAWFGDHPVVAGVIVTALAAVAWAVRSPLRGRTARLTADAAAGLRILRRPRAFLTGVASWQLAGRIVRLGAIACCLAACGLPSAVGAAALAMAVEGGTRLRFAPATGGLRVALLLYGLPAATGAAVSVGPVVAYVVGVRSIRAAISIAIAAGVLVIVFGARSPRRALRAARRLAAGGERSASRAGAET